MLANNIKRTFSLLIVGIITAIGLSGCFKGEVSVDIKPNGSGIISASIGMTQQARSLVASQGSDPFQDIKKSLADETGATQNVKFTTWIDGDYEWAKAEKEFTHLDEISKILSDNKFFNNFSIIRKRGLIQDQFTLEAESAPLNSNTSGNDSGVDPSAFIQMSLSARLPGKIIETNGIRDINDPNRIVWNIASKQSVSIKARSTVWNWFNILVITGFLLLIGGVAVSGVTYFVYAQSQKSKNFNTGRPIVNVPIPLVDFANLGMEKFLLQINDKVLNSAGQIQTTPGGIALVWKDALNQKRLIDIKILEGHQISINDQIYSATKKDTQEGIIAAFRNQVKK